MNDIELFRHLIEQLPRQIVVEVLTEYGFKLEQKPLDQKIIKILEGIKSDIRSNPTLNKPDTLTYYELIIDKAIINGNLGIGIHEFLTIVPNAANPKDSAWSLRLQLQKKLKRVGLTFRKRKDTWDIVFIEE